MPDWPRSSGPRATSVVLDRDRVIGGARPATPTRVRQWTTMPEQNEVDGVEPELRLIDSVIDRVLSRAGTAVAAGGDVRTDYDGDQFDREEREGSSRVAGLSTELEDISEVEYRQLRLEKVVLVGMWSRG